MISERMQKALNEQIVNELFASNSYLGIAAFMDSLGLKVLAEHFFKQSAEERGHALRILKYLLDVSAAVRIRPIPGSKGGYASVEEAVRTSLEQEITVTGQINDLMTLAHEEKDYATASFLRWFVDEQVEEQATMSDLLQLVQMAGDTNLLLVEDRLLRRAESAGEEEED
ncbi:ferritin [Candidatus Poribacteria bacterium]|nr:ferritin [Candidatus Poribacteria bacterium]